MKKLLVALLAAFCAAIAVPAMAQRPSTDRHVAELARFFDHAEIAEPVVYGRLAVYPVLSDGGPTLRDRWLTMDEALARGVLAISEKDGGSVPVVTVENRSTDQYVLIMTGEVIAGGKQTRTVRRDVALAPRQQISLEVFCIEAHRWQGGGGFSAGNALVPQSLNNDIKSGADQQKVWSRVAATNSALKAENATDSLEQALKSRPVQDQLGVIRRRILPHMPDGAVGFIFVDRGRAVGAELFGSEGLARAMLPKLLDSYAVDTIVLGDRRDREFRPDNRAAIDFMERMIRAGSRRSDTPGSGDGIRTSEDGLSGEGVGLDGVLVHFGAQNARPVIIHKPRPPVIWPPPRRPEPRPLIR